MSVWKDHHILVVAVVKSAEIFISLSDIHFYIFKIITISTVFILIKISLKYWQLRYSVLTNPLEIISQLFCKLLNSFMFLQVNPVVKHGMLWFMSYCDRRLMDILVSPTIFPHYFVNNLDDYIFLLFNFLLSKIHLIVLSNGRIFWSLITCNFLYNDLNVFYFVRHFYECHR